MKSHKECLICGSKALVKMEAYETSFLCKCKSCGFVFSQKIPTPEELNNHYKG
jgi:uncharacterized Zn finger protein